MMAPTGIFSNFVDIHYYFSFGFLKALFNSPMHSDQPDKEIQAGTGWSTTYIIGISGGILQRTLDDDPYGFIGQAVPTQGYLSPRNS
jgi:hypothetical protein